MIHKIKTKLQENRLKRAQKREGRMRMRELRNSVPSAFDEAIFSWIASETITHDRGRKWHIIAGSFVVVTVVYAAIFSSWTFALAVFAFAVVYYSTHLGKTPRNVEVKISGIGIKVGNRKYSYSRIRAFWLIYEPPLVKTLNLRVSGEFLMDISIQLGDQSPSEVREFLLEKIPEMEGQGESLTDILLRVLKI